MTRRISREMNPSVPTVSPTTYPVYISQGYVLLFEPPTYLPGRYHTNLEPGS